MQDIIKVLSLDDVQKAFPRRKNAITQELVDEINKCNSEGEFIVDPIENTLIRYENIIDKNKCTMREYIDAVRFCSYLVAMDDNYTEAYKRTFYYRDFVKKYKDCSTDSNDYKQLCSAASRYAKTNKVVRDILTHSQIELSLHFSSQRYVAAQELLRIGMTARYDRDRVGALKEFLAATKGPDNLKIELDVGMKESSAIQQLNEQLALFARSSLNHLEAGTTDLNKLGAMKTRDDDILEVEYE